MTRLFHCFGSIQLEGFSKLPRSSLLLRQNGIKNLPHKSKLGGKKKKKKQKEKLLSSCNKFGHRARYRFLSFPSVISSHPQSRQTSCFFLGPARSFFFFFFLASPWRLLHLADERADQLVGAYGGAKWRHSLLDSIDLWGRGCAGPNLVALAGSFLSQFSFLLFFCSKEEKKITTEQLGLIYPVSSRGHFIKKLFPFLYWRPCFQTIPAFRGISRKKKRKKGARSIYLLLESSWGQLPVPFV